MTDPLVYVVGDDTDTTWRLNEIGIAPIPYENLAELRWYEELKFCGCGCPEEVQQYIASILRAHKERSDSSWAKNNIREAINKPEMAELFILYTLDAMDLLEHGGSVGGSWLTKKGEQMMAEFGEPRD